MAEKAQKNNKNLIIGICACVLVVAAIVVAVIFATKGGTGTNSLANLSDSYFVSDDTKYVLTVDNDGSDEDEEFSTIKTHLVYTYSGDTITGMITYMEFTDANTAKSALEVYQNMDLYYNDEVSTEDLEGRMEDILKDQEVLYDKDMSLRRRKL